MPEKQHRRTPGGSAAKGGKPKYPKVKLERVGQQLRGKVFRILEESGLAFVNVGRGIPCALRLDDAEQELEVGQEIDLWVKEFQMKDRVLLTALRPRTPVEDLEMGQQLRGTVNNLVDFGGAFVDVGAERDGFLFEGEMGKHPNGEYVSVEPGQEVDVWVSHIRDDGRFCLSMRKPRVPVEELCAGQSLRGTVTNIPNFGGIFVDVGAVRDGWLPGMELRASQDGGETEDIVLEPGQEVDVWVKEVREERDFRLTLRKPRRSISSLKVGFKFEGTVTGIKGFSGAFVDIGAERDGLVHLCDISEPPPATAGAVLEIGQKVNVYVKQIKGSSSLQLTMVRPRISMRWLRVGKQLRGEVTSLLQFGGAFIDIGTVNDAVVLQADVGGPGGGEGAPPSLRVGQEVVVWVKAVHRDGKVQLTMLDPGPGAAGNRRGRRPSGPSSDSEPARRVGIA